MKLSLTGKIFIAFLLTSGLSLLLMLVSVRYFTFQGFQEYVHNRQLEELQGVTAGLEAWYKQNGSWDKLKGNRQLWHSLIRSNWFINEQGQIFSIYDSQGHKFFAVPPPFDHPGVPIPQGGPESGSPYMQPSPVRQGEFPPPPFMRERPGPGWHPMRLDSRMALFDMQNRLVIGMPGRTSISSYSKLPILSDGVQVGWLGLAPSPRLSHPQDQAFVNRQTIVIYVIGGSVLALTIIIAWLLSRHMLAPVRKLAMATRALRERRFETRIIAESSDELGQLARDFNSMARALEKYEARQQQWLADISHELRTPLAVLLGEIEALQDGVRRPDEGALLSLHKEAERLNQMVNDVHDISLAEAGDLVLSETKLDPWQVLTNTVARFKNRLEQAGVNVESDMGPSAGGIIMGDEERLTRVFSNLLENVLRHAAKPGVLKVWQKPQADSIKLYLEDSGPGVLPEALPKLFDRLYRADPSRSRATGGSGLGLAICKTIVESHGGSINALNGSTGGLLIEIVFPLR